MPSINVFLTVDTEHSIGGAFADARLKPVGNEKRIFGRIDSKEYGIPLIMDIAENFGLEVTFFVEVFNHYFFGESARREVVDFILKRGHDLQLHLHPNYLNFTLERPQEVKYSDLTGHYPLSRQIEMLAEAVQLLTSCGAPKPVAFRAGCFGANEDTLSALSTNGFFIDSSYNAAYLGGPCLFPNWELNDIAQKNGIFEFPISNFIEHTGLRHRRYMPFDINGVSFEEMRHALREAAAGRGPRNVTILLHSFSFIKAYDVQYNKTRVRKHVIRRFEKLCRFLAENRADFNVGTFGRLTQDQLFAMIRERRDTFPSAPPIRSLMRFGGQLWDRFM